MSLQEDQNVTENSIDSSLSTHVKWNSFYSIGIVVFFLIVAIVIILYRLTAPQSSLPPIEHSPTGTTPKQPPQSSASGFASDTPQSEEVPCYTITGESVFYNTILDTNELVEGADPKTFVDLTKDYKNECYGVDGRNAYFNETVIVNADPKTFTALNGTFASDESHVFFRNEVIPSADVKSFQVLESSYAKDSKNVYYLNVTIPGADPNTFTFIDYIFAKDAQRVYYFLSPIIGADPNTFEALEGEYGKDSQHVFAASCFNEGSPDCVAILDGADPATFIAFNSSYAKDRSHVYYSESSLEEITNADPESFVALDDGIAKDSLHVFVNGEVVEGMDPNTLSILHRSYIKDASHVYYLDGSVNVVPDADPATFFGVKESYYSYDARDKNHLFLNGKIVP